MDVFRPCEAWLTDVQTKTYHSERGKLAGRITYVLPKIASPNVNPRVCCPVVPRTVLVLSQLTYCWFFPNALFVLVVQCTVQLYYDFATTWYYCSSRPFSNNFPTWYSSTTLEYSELE
jgi:hypothetical protein